MTAFFSLGFAFSKAQKKELILRGLSEDVIVEIQSELDAVKSFDATVPANRREMIKQLDAIADVFRAAEEVIDATNHWTVSNLEPHAYGLRKFFRGCPKTNIQLCELKHALVSYRDGAARAKLSLGGAVPKRGPSPEYAMRAASVIKTVLERAGIALSDDEKGSLTLTISVAFEALGIAKGKPRQYAARVLAK